MKQRRFWKRPIFFVPALIVAVPAAWLAWWLGSPLFIDKTVVEAFPSIAPSDPSPVIATTEAPDSAMGSDSPPRPAASPEGDETQSAPAEGAPMGEPATEPVPEPDPPAPATTTVPPEPVALLSGMFRDADSRHKGSGDAAVYELGDGTLVLRVENLDVTNGPDLHVYLTPIADAMDRDQATAEGYLDLGSLKGNKGDQNYIILGDFDPNQDWTVVIYCVPFHVVFSTAPLAAP